MCRYVNIYCSALLGRSKRPFELARLRQGARNCSAWLVENTPPADVSEFEHARLLWGARARSVPLGRSKWPLELARLRQGARNCSAWLLENIAPADVSEFEPARLRWGARHWRSSPLGSAGPETLHWAGPREGLLRSTQRRTYSVHGMHGYALVYIYIYS